ncbi:MAG: ATP-binding protein [Prevotella sp.]
MARQVSPFQFGTLATDKNFIDRTEDRAMLKQMINSHINTMLVSPRRWGKSSLVKKTMSELATEEPDVRVCHIDAFSISSESEFYKIFASQVITCTTTKVERWISDAKRFLNGVVPQIVINDQITDFMAFDLKYVPQELDKMSILMLPEVLATEKGIRIVVCIDEFQQLAGLAEYKDMEGKMRSAWQKQEHVTYCLYGSKRHMMLDIFNNAGSPFYRFGQVVFLKKIEKKYWVEFIMSSFEETGKHISEGMASRICDIVECHSWYIQQLCFFIWSMTETEVTEETLRNGVRQVVNINTPMFQNDIEGITSSQRELLRAISNGEKQLSSATAKERYSLGNPNTLAKNKRILQEKDIIEKVDDGSFCIIDPVFRLWMKNPSGLIY